MTDDIYFGIYARTESDDEVVLEAWGEHANWEDDHTWNLAWVYKETPRSFTRAIHKIQEEGHATWTDEKGITWTTERGFCPDP